MKQPLQVLWLTKKEASEFRSQIKKIQSNEDGNQPVVAGEEGAADQAQVTLLASTQSEEHLQVEDDLEKATGKDEHKSKKKDYPNGSEGLGLKKLNSC